MRPLLSVVMPTYNGERFVAAALASVRDQHDDGIELVVVDDGSTDHTLEIVGSFADVLPIRLITPGRLGNWVAATNLGLREAIGEWACFLHQDDLWLPGRLKRLRREMENVQGALIVHNAVYVGPDGQRLGPWTCPFAEGHIPSNEFIERLLVQNFIAIPSPVFRRDEVIQSGGLDEALWFSADWDLWLRLGALGPVGFVGETLSAFRVHPASQTAARKLQPKEWEEQLTTVLARHLEIGRLAEGSVHRWSGLQWRRSRSIPRYRPRLAVNLSNRRGLLLQLLGLGPLGWRRYLRDSRIVQRVRSRLKVR